MILWKSFSIVFGSILSISNTMDLYVKNYGVYYNVCIICLFGMMEFISNSLIGKPTLYNERVFGVQTIVDRKVWLELSYR